MAKTVANEAPDAKADGDEEDTGACGKPRGGVPAADTIEDETTEGGSGRLGAEAEEGEDGINANNFRDEVEEADGRRGSSERQ